jgi:hypothetical protein
MALNLYEYTLIYANGSTHLILLLLQFSPYFHQLDTTKIILMCLSQIILSTLLRFFHINYLILFIYILLNSHVGINVLIFIIIVLPTMIYTFVLLLLFALLIILIKLMHCILCQMLHLRFCLGSYIFAFFYLNFYIINK